MKLSKIGLWLLASSLMVVLACGSNGSSVFPGMLDGGRDGTFDGPGLNFDTGTNDSGRRGTCNPLTCEKLGYNCGPAGDGCGSKLDCGTCKDPQTCGGGGQFSRCGGHAGCIPKTCKDLGISCGPAGDGCGGMLNCGGCPSGQTCGGGGTPFVCGTGFTPPDGGLDGGACVPETCASQKIFCGPAGDGCGGTLSCGSCSAPDTCGGGGTAATCGHNTSCVPKTCKDLGFTCGPAGDGCGGSLNCGTCKSPETCGGGGKPSVCGMGFIAPDGGLDGGLCVPQTCASQGISCGPAGDGCGDLLSCGSCPSGQTCGGGGTKYKCGAPSACVPKTCKDLGFNCGPAGDGCGGSLSCGSCTGIDTCGGGGTPGVCGTTFVPPDGGLDGGACVPETCASQGISCGPAGDGCGLKLNCGSCTSPDTCGGGGTPGVCGHNTTCVPTTCAALGFNCGPAGDGCGGSLDCGTCTSPDICGGGGSPGVCGDKTPCTGLCLNQNACEGGTTTLSGTVIAGTLAKYLSAGDTPDPVPNVTVYVPNCAPSAFTTGVSCSACGADVTGCPLIETTTDYLGNFTLNNVPVPPSGVIPLVIQLGRWRRIFGMGNPLNPGFNVTACAANSAGNVRMPRNHNEGDIPFTAVSTGSVDSMECVLLKMGVDQAEFTNPGGGGRIEMYSGNGAGIDATTPVETSLVPTSLPEGGTSPLNQYDQVIFPCWGVDPIPSGSTNAKTAFQQTEVIDYANGGGRVFTTHYSYSWLYNDAPFNTTATWIGDPEPVPGSSTAFTDLEYNSGTANIVSPSSFPDVTTFFQWMTNLKSNGASATGTFTVTNERNNFSAIGAGSELWMNLTGATTAISFDPTNCDKSKGLDYKCCAGSPATCVHEPTSFPMTYTFATPYSTATPPPTQCGRVIYSDYHVTNTAVGPTTFFPAECNTNEMTAQEKSLEYLIWDLASCLPGPPPPTCTPQTCADQGFNCGPAGDGCGGSLDCGTCSGCQVCGGGGTPGVCGGACCKPETCASQGIECGPAGDGCGGSLSCGSCPAGETCGGGGVDGKCGAIDSGTCTPLTCAGQGFNCGPAGDGCGGSLNCGTCSGCETCGGGGKPGVCGGTCCVPTTCSKLGIMCGPAGDGCGGTLDCGSCPMGETCGGGGTPGVCGSPPDGGACVPMTCASQGFNCGPAGDGCGGSLNCGTCSGCQVCGGGGKSGVCGGACCVPETCASQGIMCGPAGDGCGGSLNCGTCPMGMTCGGGGTPGVCGAIEGGTCMPLTCAGQGIDCGPAGDGCGGSLNCGTCPMGETCGGGGTSGKCGKPMCTPKTCKELGFNCGPAGDGCGGSLNCGTCTPPDTCGGGGTAGVCGMPVTK